MSDLARAFAALNSKATRYQRLWDYADGDHPLTYTNERLRDVFRSLEAKFTENWCAVVLGACLERISLSGFQVADEEAQARLTQLWAANDLDQEADEAHEAALVCGESYIIIWPDETDTPQAYYNDPRLCHAFYDGENPRQMSLAAKWWDGEDGHRRLTLYYPDRLEYYRAAAAETPTSEAGFVAMGPPNAPNPYGEIPVFHFRPSRRVVKSDLDDVIPIQNGINKLAADMMVVAEYGAFKQRYIISAGGTERLKNAPNEIWDLPAGDGTGQQTQVGEFSASDLGQYLDAIDRLATAIAIITRTPKHYFLTQGGAPSGEALIAMEAPLNKKAQKRIDRFAATWQHVAAFMLKVAGVTVSPHDITPKFDKPETVQPRTEAEIRQINTQAGVPLVTSLRWQGKTDAEIAQMQQDEKAAGQAQQASLGQALASAMRQRDQGQGNGTGGMLDGQPGGQPTEGQTQGEGQ